MRAPRKYLRLDPFRAARVCACGEHGFVGLTRGAVAIFSAEDLPMISGFRWFIVNPKTTRSKYAKRSPIKGEASSMHRVIMGNPESFVDHASRDGLDNRRENLRLCTPAQNSQNRKPMRGKVVPYKGVCVDTKNKCFNAIITADKKRVPIGAFLTAELAAEAYDKYAKELHGEFAVTNESLGLLRDENGNPRPPAGPQFERRQYLPERIAAATKGALLTYAEIAEIVCSTEGSVAVTVSRMRRNGQHINAVWGKPKPGLLPEAQQ